MNTLSVELENTYSIEIQNLKNFACSKPIKMDIIGDKYNTNSVTRVKYSDGQIAYFKKGIAGLKEVVAYQIGYMLGIANTFGETHKLLMPTKMANNGSVMQETPGVINIEHNLGRYLDYSNVAEMLIFDIIIGNSDRNTENFSIDYDNKKIHGIDNSEAFDYRTHFLDPCESLQECNPHMLIPKSVKEALRNHSNREFMEILNKALFHPVVLEQQNFSHLADLGKPFPAGTFNTIKYFKGMLDLVRNANTFGELKVHFHEKYVTCN